MLKKFILALLVLILSSCSSPAVPTNPAAVSTTVLSTETLAATFTPDLSARGVWLQRASMLTRRSEMPAVVLNGMIYVPGGFGPKLNGLANGMDAVTTFDAYDPASNQWKLLASMPEARNHSMVAAYKGRVYVFGGFAGVWVTYSNVWVYDPSTDHWQVLKDMPAPRTAGAAVTLGDYIYLVGGTTSQAGVILPTWRYDPAKDSWENVAPLQEPREHNNAVVLNGKIYALGGRWLKDLNSVEIYDPTSNTWTFGPPMEVARAGFGATVLDGKIYVAGGEWINVTKTLNSVEVFDSTTGSWSSLPTMPVKLHGVPLEAVDGVLYLIGGSSRSADVINSGRVYSFRP
jgi:N-acetylneuraminic acid mutarotase